MIHPDTLLRGVNPVIGMGVFARQAIPKGTIVWVHDPLDRVFTPAQLALLPRSLQFDLNHHTWLTSDGKFVLVWDNARFVNHSCSPNCLTTPYGFEIASRDIAMGEELTNDYADLGMQHNETFLCSRGEIGCRGLIEFNDAARLRPYWNVQAAESLADMWRVEQPLLFLVRPEALESLRHTRAA